uniref:Uncharacterized protein n=1 Tax=Acrobeloides nanus TaxID=290746 RepID=A0A914E2W7_9BILA
MLMGLYSIDEDFFAWRNVHGLIIRADSARNVRKVFSNGCLVPFFIYLIPRHFTLTSFARKEETFLACGVADGGFDIDPKMTLLPLSVFLGRKRVGWSS